MSFVQEFDVHRTWCQRGLAQLEVLSDWLMQHQLLNPSAQERLRQLQAQLKSDKVMVAFVAEFSRGKSELINAVFFATYGRRIMPASAGRTTMCPTELGYDPALPPCLRLLSVDTRLQPQSLLEWRSAPEKWMRIDLDVNDPQQLVQVLGKVAEVRRVSPDDARALGFWHDEAPEDNPLPGPDGLVEVPQWRHALINMAHPLLKQGLVILDTPGLNAIGAEPELTVGLLPQAHAVVFMLAADAGVSKSDLTIWREHLAPSAQRVDTRLVVLNKIDTLWDDLSSSVQIEQQLQRQREQSASVLGLPPEKVLAVSAQKGLLAKVRNDPMLLRQSRLPDLEHALAHHVLVQRRQILEETVVHKLALLRAEVEQQLDTRTRELLVQEQELEGLRGHNSIVLTQMQTRIEQEQAAFDTSGARLQAVRSVHFKLLQDLFALLSTSHLKTEVAQFAAALRQPGIKWGVKKIYTDTLTRLHHDLMRAHSLVSEAQDLLGHHFRTLNGEFGFSLQLPPVPDLLRLAQELDLIEHNHLQYLGLSNLWRLAQATFTDRLAQAVLSRLKSVFEVATTEVEAWTQAVTAQLDTQLRERRQSLGLRLRAVQRIQQADGSLDERLQSLQQQRATLLVARQAWPALCGDLPAALAPVVVPIPASSFATAPELEANCHFNL